MKKIKKMFRDKKGLTLVELLIVVAILGTLAGVVVPNSSGFISNATIKINDGWPNYKFEVMAGDGSSNNLFMVMDDTGIVKFTTTEPSPPEGGYIEHGLVAGETFVSNKTGYVSPGAKLHITAYSRIPDIISQNTFAMSKSGVQIWKLGLSSDVSLDFSGTDETMFVCARDGNMDFLATSPNLVTMSIKAFDSAGQATAERPQSWIVRNSAGDVVSLGTSSVDYNSVFFNGLDENCMLSTDFSVAHTLEVTVNGVTQTKLVVPGEKITFSIVEVDGVWYPDGDGDGAPDGNIRAVVTSNKGDGLGQQPLVGATVKAFDKAGCAASYTPDSIAVDANCVADSQCVTNLDGECDLYTGSGNYFVLVEVMDKSGKYPSHTVADVIVGGVKKTRLAFREDASWEWTITGAAVAEGTGSTMTVTLMTITLVIALLVLGGVGYLIRRTRNKK